MWYSTQNKLESLLSLLNGISLQQWITTILHTLFLKCVHALHFVFAFSSHVYLKKNDVQSENKGKQQQHTSRRVLHLISTNLCRSILVFICFNLVIRLSTRIKGEKTGTLSVFIFNFIIFIIRCNVLKYYVMI